MIFGKRAPSVELPASVAMGTCTGGSGRLCLELIGPTLRISLVRASDDAVLARATVVFADLVDALREFGTNVATTAASVAVRRLLERRLKR